MIQEVLDRYMNLKGKMKLLKDELKEAEIEIEDYYLESGEDKLYFDVSDTRMIVVERTFSVSEKLDKDGLSLETSIPKSDMVTPFDWAKLTELKKITPKQITKFTYNDKNEKIKITEKKKPKRSKQFKSKAPEGQMELEIEQEGIPMKAGEKMTLSLGGAEPTLTKHNEDGTTTEIKPVTTFFN